MTDEFKETYNKIGDIVKTLDITIEEAIPRKETETGLGYYIPFPKHVKIKFPATRAVTQAVGEEI